ncbi:MAG: phenylalanine--tRNA ligase beta subunit-related protein, partial [Candidatus Peregrinibacteria bacterium]
IHEHHTIRCWDTAYGKFGINPKKYQCSIGSLLEHVVNKGEIRHINLLVDLYNYYSLKFLLPVGGEDIDWLCGDLHLTYTTGKEAFRPLGSVDVKEVSEGEIAYKDDGGVTCRYWNHRECERTKFTPRTTNALILIEDLSRMHMDEFGRILKEIKEGIQKYIGGDLELFILTEDRPRIDLGAEGRKNVNDKKITKQEKLHYENEVKQ